MTHKVQLTLPCRSTDSMRVTADPRKLELPRLAMSNSSSDGRADEEGVTVRHPRVGCLAAGDIKHSRVHSCRDACRKRGRTPRAGLARRAIRRLTAVRGGDGAGNVRRKRSSGKRSAPRRSSVRARWLRWAGEHNVLSMTFQADPWTAQAYRRLALHPRDTRPMVERSSRQNGGKAECDQGVLAPIVRNHVETFR